VLQQLLPPSAFYPYRSMITMFDNCIASFAPIEDTICSIFEYQGAIQLSASEKKMIIERSNEKWTFAERIAKKRLLIFPISSKIGNSIRVMELLKAPKCCKISIANGINEIAYNTYLDEKKTLLHKPLIFSNVHPRSQRDHIRGRQIMVYLYLCTLLKTSLPNLLTRDISVLASQIAHLFSNEIIEVKLKMDCKELDWHNQITKKIEQI